LGVCQNPDLSDCNLYDSDEVTELKNKIAVQKNTIENLESLIRLLKGDMSRVEGGEAVMSKKHSNYKELPAVNPDRIKKLKWGF